MPTSFGAVSATKCFPLLKRISSTSLFTGAVCRPWVGTTMRGSSISIPVRVVRNHSRHIPTSAATGQSTPASRNLFVRTAV